MDQDQGVIRQVRDKEVRKELMESVLQFKQQVAVVYRIMGQDIQSSISNLLIAQLNDVAYKAIRKAGVQKRLDERAIKNDEFFKKNDANLDAAHQKLDFDKIKQNHEQKMIDKLGDCPLSQCNAVELMENKDCMCLGLSIGRS